MDNDKRDYISTDLSTFGSEKPDDKQLEILKLIYGEVNSNYRNLAYIRFKLLGFVPAIDNKLVAATGSFKLNNL